MGTIKGAGLMRQELHGMPDRPSAAARVFVILMFAAFVAPFVPLVVASFSFRWHWPDLLPTRWLWNVRDETPFPVGWDYLLSPVSRLGSAFANTVAIGLVVAALALMTGVPAAYVLARYDFRAKGVAEFFLLLPIIVPQVSIGIGMLLLFMRVGLFRTYPGIVLAHLVPALPYAIRILTAMFQNLDPGYEEVARTLGADRLARLRHVTLPLIAAGLATAGLFAFLISTNIFLLTFLISGGRIATLPTMLFSHIGSGGPLDATTAGLVLIVSVPGLLFLFIADRITGSGLSLATAPAGSRAKEDR